MRVKYDDWETYLQKGDTYFDAESGEHNEEIAHYHAVKRDGGEDYEKKFILMFDNIDGHVLCGLCKYKNK